MPRKHSNQSNPVAAAIELLAERVTPVATLTINVDQVDRMGVRHLGLEHLGRWIELSASASAGGDVAIVRAVAGRLVGIRPGSQKTGSVAPTRKLIIQCGAVAEAVEYSLDYPVLVAPRSWS